MNDELFKELMMRIPYGVCLVNQQGTVFKPEAIHIVNKTVSYTVKDMTITENLDSCRMVLLPKKAFLQQIVFNGHMVCPIKSWYENFYKHSKDYQLLKEEKTPDSLLEFAKKCFMEEGIGIPTEIFMPYLLKFHIDFNNLIANGHAYSAIDFVNPY